MPEELLDEIDKFVIALEEASVWHNSKKSVAHVESREDEKGKSYIYEFYCYIRIVADLMRNYVLEYIPGEGKFPHKFPQAPANKKGKPRFHAYEKRKSNKKGSLKFQLCAGTKINGKFQSENNHPDISFQKAKASEDPGCNDLILIYDAKFQEDPKSNLNKEEVYKFATIVRCFDLNKKKKKALKIKFNDLVGLEGNCLLTNVSAHHKMDDFIKSEYIREVENFWVGKKFAVKGI
ncbi:MAG: hypothetical protein JSV88_10120 [Candidatus Aminicenantes bacterium]|nr:MAG: hypothetical protein JSV88_10120 [Candidatus Aminicenantes bacterium]